MSKAVFLSVAFALPLRCLSRPKRFAAITSSRVPPTFMLRSVSPMARLD